MGHKRQKVFKTNDIFVLLPEPIQRTVAMIRMLNAQALEVTAEFDRLSGGMNKYVNRNSAMIRDEVGLAESLARFAVVLNRASFALQTELMDNDQADTNATGVFPYPLTSPNTSIKLNPGVAQAMRLARLTRFSATEFLRLGTMLYRTATKLQESTPMYERLSDAKKGAYAQTQPGYYVVKGHTDARDGSAQIERLPDICERLFGTRQNWQLIADHNGIKYPYTLEIGRVLEIPDLLVPQSDVIEEEENAPFQALRAAMNALRLKLDRIPQLVVDEYPEYETVITPGGITPSRILYTRINTLGTDWYLDSVYDETRGYSGRTKDFVKTDRNQIAIRSGVDNFLLGMRRLFHTQVGWVTLRREFGHKYDELVGNVKNPRLELIMARIFTIECLQQESDRIERVTDIQAQRNYGSIGIAVTLVPKGFVNDFMIHLPIPELGGKGKRVVNKPIPLPSPENVRD